MLLREITIQNLRLLQDVRIPFEREGLPRLWTVFIGRNGTGKTSILQAIALAAAGNAGALSLAEKVREQLPDIRVADETSIVAKFGFGDIGQKYGVKPHQVVGSVPTGLGVELRIPRGRDPLRGISWYMDGATEGWTTNQEVPASRREVGPATEHTDPLVRARAEDLNHWFVAGYGMFRHAPERQLGAMPPSWPSVDRMRPLFEHTPLIGPNFIDILADSLKGEFGRILQQIIKRSNGVLPGVVDLERRGQGGVRTAHDMTKRSRFVEQVGHDEKLKFPATWFAHGHQSTIAWLSDLIGQVLLEADSCVEPGDMEGIVLIDEIDLYLHPTWQVTFIRAL